MTSPRLPGAALVAALMVLVGCSAPDDEPGDVGGTADTGTPFLLDGGGDADVQRTYCGDGTTDGPYVEAAVEYACSGNVGLRSIVELYQCTGCDGPLLCASCASTPHYYVQIDLHAWDEDLTGATLTQDGDYAYRCAIGSGCIEPKAFNVNIEEHHPGECVRGTYHLEFEGGHVEEGTFDAASPGPPSEDKIASCG